jgi:hypothetical protein
MKAIFIDESGDHNLSEVDNTYPLFVLGGVMLDKEYAENELVKRIDKRNYVAAAQVFS